MPKESRPFEYRVGLTPSSVKIITDYGNRVYIEKDAGSYAGYSNLEYEKAGAIIVYDKEEIFARPDVMIKFSRPTYEEIELMKDGIILMGFLHMHASKRDKLELLKKKKITTIAYEFLQDNGEFPILKPISTLAGKMIPNIAGQLLTNLHGGSGIVISGAPGIPPAEIVIFGAGNAGITIARQFINIGAQVTVLDKNIKRLEIISEMTGSKIVTMLSTQRNIEKVMAYADIVITCAQSVGDIAPTILDDELIKSMKERSVLIDLAIDNGGNSTTSRPTNHGSPTYIMYNVIHYCVPNISSIVARSASYALNNAIIPYLTNLIMDPMRSAVEFIGSDTFWKTGLVCYKGEPIHQSIRKRFEQSVTFNDK